MRERGFRTVMVDLEGCQTAGLALLTQRWIPGRIDGRTPQSVECSLRFQDKLRTGFAPLGPSRTDRLGSSCSRSRS